MLKKFKISFIAFGKKEKEVVIEATSKYDAKQKFYRMHPKYEVVMIEEVEE